MGKNSIAIVRPCSFMPPVVIHELLIRTAPSDVAFLPTRMVEHAKASRGIQASGPMTPSRTMSFRDFSYLNNGKIP
jgi:hypothetical protein